MFLNNSLVGGRAVHSDVEPTNQNSIWIDESVAGTMTVKVYSEELEQWVTLSTVSTL